MNDSCWGRGLSRLHGSLGSTLSTLLRPTCSARTATGWHGRFGVQESVTDNCWKSGYALVWTAGHSKVDPWHAAEAWLQCTHCAKVAWAVWKIGESTQ